MYTFEFFFFSCTRKMQQPTANEFYDAMVSHDRKVIDAYISGGGDVNEGGGRAVIHLIVDGSESTDALDIIADMVNAGLDVHTKDVNGKDLITLIVEKSEQPLLALPLLSKDETLARVKNAEGRTILHLVAFACGTVNDERYKDDCVFLAQVLKLCGVDAGEKDKKGLMACDYLEMAEIRCPDCDPTKKNNEMRNMLGCEINDDDDNDVNFPLIPPSPQLETMEWSKSLPEVFDPVMYETISAQTYLDEDELNVIFIDANGKSAIGFSKESLDRFTDKLYYECTQQNTRMTVALDIVKHIPYVILPGQLQYYVHAEQLNAVLMNNDDRVYVLEESRKMVYTTSIGSVNVRGDGRDYQGNQINVISADHCQPGSDKTLYTIKVAEISNGVTGGGGYRRTRRRTQRRRRRRSTKQRRNFWK